MKLKPNAELLITNNFFEDLCMEFVDLNFYLEKEDLENVKGAINTLKELRDIFQDNDLLEETFI